MFENVAGWAEPWGTSTGVQDPLPSGVLRGTQGTQRGWASHSPSRPKRGCQSLWPSHVVRWGPFPLSCGPPCKGHSGQPWPGPAGHPAGVPVGVAGTLPRNAAGSWQARTQGFQRCVAPPTPRASHPFRGIPGALFGFCPGVGGARSPSRHLQGQSLAEVRGRDGPGSPRVSPAWQGWRRLLHWGLRSELG